jgi:eukaryotic-like serine/threonine-protein kinase
MPGTVIGSYSLLEKIGEGGMGTVWLAEHTLLGRRAAIKLLHPTYSTNERIVERFFNEAKAVAAIADPGIVQVFDFGIHSDGSPYLVMELLEGETLDARLRRLSRLAPADAVRLMRQVAVSLAAAHGKGVIHRDLKPENLFVARDPAVPGGERVKVLDFGIAKLSHGDGKHKTRTGAVLGTPAYMSPEQCRAIGNLDHRTDIYSFGAVLFCLVTGRPPFEGEGAGDAIISHVRDQPPVPSSIAPGLPFRLDSIILRCLEKDPARRYQGMDELAQALDGFDASPGARAATAGTEGRQATQGAAAAAMLLPHATTTISDAPGEVASGSRSARRRWIGLAAGATAALVIASAIAVSGTDHPDQAPPPDTREPSGSAGAAVSPVSPDAPAAVVPDEDTAGAAATIDRPAATSAEPAAPDAPSAAGAVPAAPDAPPATEQTLPADAGSVLADRAEPPADAALTAIPERQPTPVQRPGDHRRGKENSTRHGADTKASPRNPGRIDRGD